MDDDASDIIELGRQLRNVRRSHSRTLQYVARKTGISLARLSRMEVGESRPSRGELETILDALQADAQERATTIAHMRTAFWHVEPLTKPLFYGPEVDFQDRILGYEFKATQIDSLDSNHVPGILQTASYALTVLRAFGQFDETTAEKIVQQRMERQRHLFDVSRIFRILVTEIALRSQYLSNDATCAQFQQMSSLSSLQNVSLGIVPMATRLPVVPYPFLLYDDAVVIFEDYFLSVESQYEIELQKARRNMTLLSEVAVWGDDARTLLQQLIDEIQNAPVP
jgi:transcriptional regulator with XRE-family HTH domain